MNDGGIVCNTPNVLQKNRNFYGFPKFNFIIHMYIIFAKVFYNFAFIRINIIDLAVFNSTFAKIDLFQVIVYVRQIVEYKQRIAKF